MSDYQFSKTEIKIQPYADAIGPFTFDLGPQFPTGTTLASVIVKSWLGAVETTSDLIHSSGITTGDIVGVYFDYPGDAKLGKHKLTFEYTLDTGAKDEADFYCVNVLKV